MLLTPGPYNETYFEHAYLARYLGFPLVEGSDLTVRDDRVWLKTLGGLQRVDAILRRLDDDYCDPLELRADSALGVPGLTACARRGNVLLANALGSGVLESGALLGFLPTLCATPARRGAAAAVGRDLVVRRAGGASTTPGSGLERLVIKPLERSPSERPIVRRRPRPRPSASRCCERIARAAAALRRAGVGAPVAGAGARGRAPAEAFAARTVGLRVFAVRHARAASA